MQHQNNIWKALAKAVYDANVWHRAKLEDYTLERLTTDPVLTDTALVSLPAERAALREPRLSSCGLAEDSLAAWAHNNGLGVAENSGSAKTT
jgi:hypothetical protein